MTPRFSCATWARHFLFLSLAIMLAGCTSQLGGSISGLTADGLVLANGTDTVSPPANATSFVFSTRVSEGTTYNVTVQTQPEGLTCSVANGAGTMGTVAVSDVTVTCVPSAQPLGGTINGLTADGLVLANGDDTLNPALNTTSFTFPTLVNQGATYNVTVQSQPSGLTCTVANGSGTMGSAPLSNVAVSCAGKAAVVTTLAGTGQPGMADGPGNAASFYNPLGVAVDGTGNVYVADVSNRAIRKITPQGVVSTLRVPTSHPDAVAVDSAGNVYVANSQTNAIYRITPQGILSILAGSSTGQNGSLNGPASSALFHSPQGVAVDAAGNVYVADTANNQIRKITPDGMVSTLAGSGGSGANVINGPGNTANFAFPTSVAVDAAGNVYVADFGHNMIRKITPDGMVSTLAGSGAYVSADGPGATASFDRPYGVAVDSAGNVYVAEPPAGKIRKITPDGIVSTLADNSSYNPLTNPIRFSNPSGVAVDNAGNVYVADTSNHMIRKIVMQ